MKLCPKCKGEYSLEEYGKNHWCLTCHNSYGREYYAKDKDKSAKRSKKQFDTFYCTIKGRATHLLNNARARAKRNNIDCTISQEWIIERLERGRCEMTDLPLVIEINGGKGHKNNSFAPSLDKIDTTKGYTPDNVRLVCWIYNRARGAFPDSDLLTMAKALVDKNSEPDKIK